MNNKPSNILQRNIEEENELREEELLERVNRLKSVSIDIQSYMKNEKGSLNRLGKDYDSSSGMIKNSITKMGSNINSHIISFYNIDLMK